MATTFGSPTSPKNFATTSSNLSWPDSTHAACLMVCERSCLPAPRTTASNGGFALTINVSVGVLRTGTLRCISTLAAADELMALGCRLGVCASAGAGGGTAFADCAGMVMVSWQDGHSISEPAPELSTASSCSQLGQSKTISISVKSFGVRLFPDTKPARPRRPEENYPPLKPACEPRPPAAYLRHEIAHRTTLV